MKIMQILKHNKNHNRIDSKKLNHHKTKLNRNNKLPKSNKFKNRKNYNNNNKNKIKNK